LPNLDLGDEGGYNLIMFLKKNNALENFDISGNGLGKKSITAIAQLLKRNGPQLTRLDLSCNKLGTYSPAVVEEAKDGIVPILAPVAPDLGNGY
jgi:Leucine-rich repeat (LRR) protein